MSAGAIAATCRHALKPNSLRRSHAVAFRAQGTAHHSPLRLCTTNHPTGWTSGQQHNSHGAHDRWTAAGLAAAAAAVVGFGTRGSCQQENPKPGPVAIQSHPSAVRGQTTKMWYFYKGLPHPGQGDLDELKVFGGSVYPELAEDICRLLGVKCGKVKLSKFADGECDVVIEETVLGKDIFLVSPTHTNDSLMELLLTIAAARRSSADRITAVIPFYGYARQDRRYAREPIAAADIALMLESMGVDRVMAVDLHTGQTQGFFSPHTPVDHLMPSGAAAAYFGELLAELDFEGLGLKRHVVVVAPQEGQVGRANMFKDRLAPYLPDDMAVSLAFVSRSSSQARDTGREEVHKHLVGEVRGCVCIIVDDLVDTAKTLANAVYGLHSHGAGKIMAFATHGRFSGGGEDRVLALDPLDSLVICNTLPHRTPQGKIVQRPPDGKIKELSLAPLLAEAIYRVHCRIPFPELLYGTQTHERGMPGRQQEAGPNDATDPDFVYESRDGKRDPASGPQAEVA